MGCIRYRRARAGPVRGEVRARGRSTTCPKRPSADTSCIRRFLLASTTANIDAGLPEGGQIEGLVQGAAPACRSRGWKFVPMVLVPRSGRNAPRPTGRSLWIAGLETSSYHLSFWPERPYVAFSITTKAKLFGSIKGKRSQAQMPACSPATTISECSEQCKYRRTDARSKGMYYRIRGESNRGYCTEPNEAGEYELSRFATGTDKWNSVLDSSPTNMKFSTGTTSACTPGTDVAAHHRRGKYHGYRRGSKREIRNYRGTRTGCSRWAGALRCQGMRGKYKQRPSAMRRSQRAGRIRN